MDTLECTFDARGVAETLAARMGGQLTEWSCGPNGGYSVTVTKATPEQRAQGFSDHAHVTITAPSLTVTGSLEMPYERKFRERVAAQIRGDVRLERAREICIATDYWNAASENKERDAQKAVKPSRDLWDWRAIPLGQGIGHAARIERLEAAVMLLASGSSFESLRQFLSLEVDPELRNVLERRVTYAKPV